jgi:hypothetical protein
MKFVYDDGGRAAAGYKGRTGDCVVRAIAIACQIPYQEVYDAINVLSRTEGNHGTRKRSSARGGVRRTTYEEYLRQLGWVWVATMRIGSGCRVHLKVEELPAGRLIVRLSRHLCAVVDGVTHDIYNPDRQGSRCVYGYFTRGQTHNAAEECA